MAATLGSGLASGTAVPDDDEALYAWVADHLGVRLPRQACCPEHRAPFEAFADAYFARSPIAVWIGSRGFAGKSLALATLALTEATTLGAGVRVLGGSADQSENVVRYTDGMIELPTFPGHLLARSGAPGGRRVHQSGLTKTRIRLANGGSLVATAASSRAVRGPHDPRLRIDEADELSLSVFDAALGQTMAKSGVSAQTVVASTWHYPEGTVTEVLRRAADRGWPLYRWCYKCTTQTPSNPTGWLDPTEVERKRQEVPAAMWSAEYDLSEPVPDSRAFVPDAVEAMFKPDLGVFRGAPGEYIEIEEPVEGARYATGADWAKERDWTVIVTLRYDVRPARLVAYERIARMPWPAMVARFDRRVQRFPGLAYYDATGIGNVVRDLITVPAKGVVLVGRDWAGALSQYVVGVEDGQVAAPRIEHPFAEHKFAAVDDVFGSGHLPDSVCAMALAWIGAAPRAVMAGRLSA